MASKVIKQSFARSPTIRGYAAAAAAQAASHPLPNLDPKVTKLSSGLVVASQDNNLPLSRVAIYVRGGARYEAPENVGAAHMLRLCAGLRTEQDSQFFITKHLQLTGSVLGVNFGKEHIAYVIDATRNTLEDGVNILSSIASAPLFKFWEVAEQKNRAKLDVAGRCNTTIALEALHKAAYRNGGLGNAMYMPSYCVGEISPEMLKSHFDATHVSGNAALVGVGVDHETLVELASELSFSQGSATASESPYKGGDVRTDTGGSTATVFVAGPGASLGSKDFLALAVAAQVLGTGPGVRYGSNTSGHLAQSCPDALSISALNVSHSDSGLFGFSLTVPAGAADKAVRGAVNAMKGLKVTDAELKGAKQRAKAAILMNVECSANGLEDFGLQALLRGGYECPADLAAAVDTITASQVQTAVSKCMSGKASLGAAGTLYNVPYLDQL